MQTRNSGSANSFVTYNTHLPMIQPAEQKQAKSLTRLRSYSRMTSKKQSQPDLSRIIINIADFEYPRNRHADQVCKTYYRMINTNPKFAKQVMIEQEQKAKQ
jgi:hypothetical protein